MLAPGQPVMTTSHLAIASLSLFSDRAYKQATRKKIKSALQSMVATRMVGFQTKRQQKSARALMARMRETLESDDIEYGNYRPFAICGALGDLGRTAPKAVLGELLFAAVQDMSMDSLSAVPLTQETEQHIAAQLGKALEEHVAAVKAGKADESPLTRLCRLLAGMRTRNPDSANGGQGLDRDTDSEFGSEAEDTDDFFDPSDEASSDKWSGSEETDSEVDDSDLEDAGGGGSAAGEEADQPAEGVEDWGMDVCSVLVALQRLFCHLLKLESKQSSLSGYSVIDFIAEHPNLRDTFLHAVALSDSEADANGKAAVSGADCDPTNAALQPAGNCLPVPAILNHLAAISAEAEGATPYDTDHALGAVTWLAALEKALCEQLRIASFESQQHCSFLSFLVKHADELPSELVSRLEGFGLPGQHKATQRAAAGVEQRNRVLRELYVTATRFGLKLSIEDVQAALAMHFSAAPFACMAVSQAEWSALQREWATAPEAAPTTAVTSTPALCAITVCSESEAARAAFLHMYHGQRTALATAASPVSFAECCQLLCAVPLLADIAEELHWEHSLSPFFGSLENFLMNHAGDALLTGQHFSQVACSRWVRLPSPLPRVGGLLEQFEEGNAAAEPVQLAVAVVAEALQAGHISSVPTAMIAGHIRAIYALCRQRRPAEDEHKILHFAWRVFQMLPPSLRGKYGLELVIEPALRDLPGWDSRMPEMCTSAGDWVALRSAALAAGNAHWLAAPLPVTLTTEKRVSYSSGQQSGVFGALTQGADGAASTGKRAVTQPKTVTAAEPDKNSLPSRPLSTPSQMTVRKSGGVDGTMQDTSTESVAECRALLTRIHEKFGEGLDSTVQPEQLGPLQELRAYAGRTTKYLAKELYASEVHFLMELVQNADDCRYPPTVSPSFEISLRDDVIELRTNEASQIGVCFCRRCMLIVCLFTSSFLHVGGG